MMKTVLSVLVLSSALVALSGCKQMTPTKAAKEMTKTLGIPVEYKAADDDACAKEQIFTFLNQYLAMGADEQSTVRTILKQRYKSVTLHGTANTGKISGRWVALQLTEPNGNSGSNVVNEKIFVDEKQTSGTVAATTVDTGNEMLSIARQSMISTVARTRYTTTKYSIFKIITDEQGAEAASVDPSFPVYKRFDDSPRMECSKLIHLKDLI
jgi:hypothetical protein